MLHGRRYWMVALCAAMVSQGALALDAAPLPDGFEPWSEDGFIVGVFVKAHEHDEQPAAVTALEQARAQCRARQVELRVAGDPEVLEDSEHWLYRTRTHAVVFSRSHDIRSNPDTCVAEVYEKRTREHVLVADGWVYHLSPKVEGKPTMAGQRSLQDVSEWPDPFDKGIDCGPDSRCKSMRIAGISARCTGASGLVGFSTCVSTESGLLHDMLVADAFWTDDGQFRQFKLDEVRRGVRLSRSLFDLSVEWPGAQ
jgi:hypothetical protein